MLQVLSGIRFFHLQLLILVVVIPCLLFLLVVPLCRGGCSSKFVFVDRSADGRFFMPFTKTFAVQLLSFYIQLKLAIFKVTQYLFCTMDYICIQSFGSSPSAIFFFRRLSFCLPCGRGCCLGLVQFQQGFSCTNYSLYHHQPTSSTLAGENLQMLLIFHLKLLQDLLGVVFCPNSFCCILLFLFFYPYLFFV